MRNGRLPAESERNVSGSRLAPEPTVIAPPTRSTRHAGVAAASRPARWSARKASPRVEHHPRDRDHGSQKSTGSSTPTSVRSPETGAPLDVSVVRGSSASLWRRPADLTWAEPGFRRRSHGSELDSMPIGDPPRVGACRVAHDSGRCRNRARTSGVTSGTFIGRGDGWETERIRPGSCHFPW